jgi:hypothetical protein
MTQHLAALVYARTIKLDMYTMMTEIKRIPTECGMTCICRDAMENLKKRCIKLEEGGYACEETGFIINSIDEMQIVFANFGSSTMVVTEESLSSTRNAINSLCDKAEVSLGGQDENGNKTSGVENAASFVRKNYGLVFGV